MVRVIFAAVASRWYVPVAVLLLAGVLGGILAHGGGVYTTRTRLTFTYPSTPTLALYNGTTDESIISFATAVARVINDGHRSIEYSSADAPYYGAGIREGALVSVPNSGNQWYVNYSEANVDILIVSRDEATVRNKQRELIAEVLETAMVQQEMLNIQADSAIRVTVDPLTLAVEEISPSRLELALAFSALIAAGMIASAWACLAIDRLPKLYPRYRSQMHKEQL